MFALIEVDHADLGALFKSREEALQALNEIRRRVPWEAESFSVVELDGDGFPVGEVIEEKAAAAR